MTISGFVAYVKQVWKNKPDTSSPLSAERLNTIEGGIKGNSDAIEAIAAAVVNQIVNEPNKIASMAALYSVNSQVTQLNSDFTAISGRIQLVISDCNNPGTTTVNRIYMGRVNLGAANAPTTTRYGMLFGIYIDSTQYGIQMIAEMISTPTLYVRSLTSGTWNAWVEK